MNQSKIVETILSHISEHRSVRSYKSDEIEDDILDSILNAGVRASSSGNMQSYSIIVTRDKNLRKELYPLHFNQDMVIEAPVLLTFCADFNRMRKWLEVSKAPENFDNFMSFMIGAIDATLASQNCALAAEAQGLGVCYMGTTLANAEEIGPLLNLPKGVVPIVGFSLGYPNGVTTKKDRLPMEGLVHYEKYEDYDSDDILQIYRDREDKGMKRYRSVASLKKLIEDSDVENLAQVYPKIKYTKESHIGYSQSLMRYLEEQSFLNEA
jgi:nitroreductase